MKILLYTRLYMAALVAASCRAGVLDMTGALILMVGGSIGAVLVYPYAFPHRK